MSQLTKTETKVVHCISQGYVFKEIADKMHVSIHTVSTHVTNVRHKWNARNIADITRMYILSLEDPRLVLKAVVCLLIHLGIILFEAAPEMRRPVQSRSSRVSASRTLKTNNTIYYA